MGEVTVKQVIVMRKDLGMRKGKMIAQGSHASMQFLLRNRDRLCYNLRTEKNQMVSDFSHVERQWLEGAFTKICVSVNSEEELLDIHDLAVSNNLESHLIRDNGATEFNGEKTFTCCAIGPDYDYLIDKITGRLKLL